MRNEISDAALDNYYRNVFIGAYGYDPLEGPYETQEEDDYFDEWPELDDGPEEMED